MALYFYDLRLKTLGSPFTLVMCQAKHRNQEDPNVKNNLMAFIRWFSRRLTFNELASVVPVLQEVLSGARHDIELQPEQEREPHYRQFRVDPTAPLLAAPNPTSSTSATKDWKLLQARHKEQYGHEIPTVRRRANSPAPPDQCTCRHCHAPARYLYFNNGKKASQVLCKICGGTSSTDKPRRAGQARYWCPHCGYALFRWKEDGLSTAHKCPNHQCPFYLKNLAALTPAERQMRDQGNTSQFKLHYIFREYHYAAHDLPLRRPGEAPVDLNRIHNNLHTVGLSLTFSVCFGLSARMTAQALERVFGISLSHQSVINYIRASAWQLRDLVDQHAPTPTSTSAADETYIQVEGLTRYTWFIIEKSTRAICGYNLSETRGAEHALALLYNCFGPPEQPKCAHAQLVTDGLPSYDSATVAYNTAAAKTTGQEVLTKHTVIGLQNLDPESETYREYKQLVERLNRTYKFHTRPRAGFKDFDGAVALTTLFVAFYNFMRPHGALKGKTPVEISSLKGKTLYPDMWIQLLRQAA